MMEDNDWKPISMAENDPWVTQGGAVLTYGVHTEYAPPGASKQVKPGDHWFAIALLDIWRTPPPHKWVFAKDGTPLWSNPTHWKYLQPPAKELNDV